MNIRTASAYISPAGSKVILRLLVDELVLGTKGHAKVLGI